MKGVHVGNNINYEVAKRETYYEVAKRETWEKMLIKIWAS